MGRELAQPRVMVAKKREAQDRVLGLLAQGVRIKAAMQAVHRKENTFWHWRAEDPWFKDRSDAARTKEAGEKELPFTTARKMYFGMETPWHQQKIVEAIDAAKPRSITMVLLPPGGGKTTVLEDYYNWKLGEDPNWRFCVISESLGLGRKIIGHVKDRMEDYAQFAIYIDKYGPFRAPDRELNRPWNADYIKVVKASSGERDYSLECKGAGSKIYGASFDDIILDDIQSLETLNQTPKLLEYIRQTVFTRMMRANTKGRIFIIGTRVGAGDIYEELLKLNVDINLIKIPALIENPHDGTFTSYFPPRTMSNGEVMGFSLEDLKIIEEFVGPEVWSRVYMQEPVSKRGQTFTEAMWKKAQDETRIVSNTNQHYGSFRMLAVDPALGGHNVWRVAAMDFDRLYLLDGMHEEGLVRYEDIYAGIDRLATLWKPNVLILEGNAIQKGLLRDDRVEEMARRHGFRIEGHQTGRNKQDDVIGVASMGGAFMRGEISIPAGDDESRQNFAPMKADLMRWRPDVPSRLLQQDEVMCLWFLYLYWQRTKSELAVKIPDHVRRPGLPWKPTRYPVAAAR